MELLKKFEYKISITKPIVVMLQDPEDVDMEFTIKLLKDAKEQNSVTKYNVHSPSKADIVIINADNKHAYSPDKPIYLGTYKKQYKLFMKYVLKPETQDSERTIVLGFFTEKIKD